jgi:hypothetical protein
MKNRQLHSLFPEIKTKIQRGPGFGNYGAIDHLPCDMRGRQIFFLRLPLDGSTAARWPISRPLNTKVVPRRISDLERGHKFHISGLILTKMPATFTKLFSLFL